MCNHKSINEKGGNITKHLNFAKDDLFEIDDDENDKENRMPGVE